MKIKYFFNSQNGVVAMQKLLLIMVFFCSFIALKAQTTEVIPAGSYIINMGVVNQTVGNGLKPYGLIYEMLKTYAVPIKWVINPSKVKDGIDFSHNGINYAGGTFIIPAEFRNATINARIIAWQNAGVIGATSVAPLTLPVYKTLYAAPNWTMDLDNGPLALKFFTDAGIPSTAYGGSSSSNWTRPSQLDQCDDIFVMPHADPLWSTHSNLITWNSLYKGSIWLGCHAVSALENMYNPANTSQQANFLSQKVTTAGPNIILPVPGSTAYAQNSLVLWDPAKGGHDDSTPPFLTNSGTVTSGQIAPPSDPVSQFMGAPDGALTANGSEQIYVPVKGGGWRSTTQIITWDPTPPAFNVPGVGINPSVALAYGRAYGNSSNGWVMISAGHNNNEGPVTASVATKRAFFNFSLLAVADKVVIPTITGITGNPVVTPGAPISLGVTVPSPATLAGFTFQWSATCGGTFSPSTTASSVTFTPAAVVGSVTCNITVRITDPCGRVSFDTRTITVQCALTAGTSVQLPCGGGSNGVITMTMSGAPAPYTYTWTRTEGGTGSGTGTVISGLGAGTYNVTVTAANGCTTTFSRTLTNSTPIIVTATPTSVLCNGSATGTISTTVSGGAPGYTYSWPGGVTTANRSGLTGGTYTVTVTDTRGCTGTASATVAQPTLITATPTITPVNCFGEASGTINLAVSGGTSPYTYLWNDGVVTQNRTGLVAGTYSVVVTDANGCTRSVSSISVTQPAAALTLTSTVTNITCNGNNNGTATVTPSGGTTPYTYNWNGTPTGDGTATITGLATGNYSVTVTDARGCTAVRTVNITQPNPLTLTAAFVNPSCPPGVATLGNNGSITLTVGGGTTPYSYFWTASGGGIIPSGQATSQNLTLLVAGTYTVVVTDANGCTRTTSVTLTNLFPVPTAPPIIKF
jgi:SprB repeat